MEVWNVRSEVRQGRKERVDIAEWTSAYNSLTGMWRYQQSHLAVRFEHISAANIALSCQSFELNMEPEVIRTKYCRNCKNRINFMHFEIHQERCRPPINVIKPSPAKGSKEIEKKEFSNPDSEDEYFPCHLCGFKRTLKDLDSHQFRCPNKQIECPQCRLSFPKDLMNDHKNHCLRQAASQPFNHRFEVARVSVAPSQPVPPDAAEEERRKKVEMRPMLREQHLLSPSPELRDNREGRLPSNSSRMNDYFPLRSPLPLQERVRPNINQRRMNNREHSSESQSNQRSETDIHFPNRLRREELEIARPVRYEDFRLLLGRSQEAERLRSQQQSQQIIRRALDERNREQIIRELRERNSVVSLREERLFLQDQRLKALASRDRHFQQMERMFATKRAEQAERMRQNEQIRLQTEQRRLRLETEAAAEEELRRQRMARRELAVQRVASRRGNCNQPDGITKSDLKKLKNIKYKKTSNEEESCSICCNQLLEKQLVKDLPCKHYYHSECIQKWLMINKTCPLCKSDISQVIKLIKEEENKRRIAKKMNNSSVVYQKPPVSKTGSSSQTFSRSTNWLQEDVEEADLNYLEDYEEERGLITRDRS